MLLRDHPLMRYRGVPNWPPAWTWIRGGRDRQPRAEVGILKRVLPSKIRSEDRCFLLNSYQGSEYLRCLLFDNRSFCKHIAGLLQFCCNRRIADIGSLDLPTPVISRRPQLNELSRTIDPFQGQQSEVSRLWQG